MHYNKSLMLVNVLAVLCIDYTAQKYVILIGQLKCNKKAYAKPR